MTEYDSGTATTTVANHIAFDSFRRRTQSAPALGEFDISYTGKWFDRDTGLSWHWNRWYNPGIQRWMSEDPIGFEGDDANLSRYVGNATTTYADPSGLAKEQHRWRGTRGGKQGTFYQWESYERQFIFWKGNSTFGPITFMPDAIPGVGDLGGLCSPSLRGKYAQVGNAADQAGEVAQAGVTVAAVGIPGPDDVAVGVGSRLGYELIKRGGKWAVRAGGKILRGSDEAAALRRINQAIYDDLVKQAQRRYPHLAGTTQCHHIAPKYLGGPSTAIARF